MQVLKALAALMLCGSMTLNALAQKLEIDHSLSTRYGELAFGHEGPFSSVLKFRDTTMKKHVADGTMFSYVEDFGVKQFGKYDLVLASTSLGGTACPANYGLLVIAGSRLSLYEFGNCNEEVTWRVHSDRIVVDIPSSGRGKANARQTVTIQDVAGSLKVSVNGAARQPRVLN